MDDTARVSVSVSVPPQAAFEIFTHDIDRWWRRGPKFRHAGRRSGFIRLEPHVAATALRPDHPARHALERAAFTRMIGLWWGDQMASLREYSSCNSVT